MGRTKTVGLYATVGEDYVTITVGYKDYTNCGRGLCAKTVGYYVNCRAEWLRVRLRVRMVKGSTLTVGNFLSLENLNVIIRAIN